MDDIDFMKHVQAFDAVATDSSRGSIERIMEKAREDMARKGVSQKEWEEYSERLSDSISKKAAEKSRVALSDPMASFFATKLEHTHLFSVSDGY